MPFKVAKQFRYLRNLMRKTSEDIFEEKMAHFAEGKDDTDHKDLATTLRKDHDLLLQSGMFLIFFQ